MTRSLVYLRHIFVRLLFLLLKKFAVRPYAASCQQQLMHFVLIVSLDHFPACFKEDSHLQHVTRKDKGKQRKHVKYGAFRIIALLVLTINMIKIV